MFKLEIYRGFKDGSLMAVDALIDNIYKDEITQDGHFIQVYDFSNVRMYKSIDDEIGEPLTQDQKENLYEHIIYQHHISRGKHEF